MHPFPDFSARNSYKKVFSSGRIQLPNNESVFIYVSPPPAGAALAQFAPGAVLASTIPAPAMVMSTSPGSGPDVIVGTWPPAS